MHGNSRVLIVGAGPTGLLLALVLTRLGIRVRIIDKASGPGTTTRALVVHARTLEFYRQLGIADDAIARGIKFAGASLWARGRKAGHIAFGDIGKGESPYPFMLILSQDKHEEFLIEHLARAGIPVERGTELVAFVDRGDSVEATLTGPQGEERFACEWLAGCDGARSAVRETLKLGFPGGTYQRIFYVADVHGSGPAIDGELNLALDDADFLAIFPLPGAGNARLIGTVKREAGEAERKLEWRDVSAPILEHMRFQVASVNWFSTYHVHHRVVERFRVGRAFLLGDAAHIHSPVGGQGMNTGLGDAMNLAWKLAAVIDGRAPQALLDTYGSERIAFARQLVATTDRAFTFVTSDGPIARFVRLDIVPRLLPAVLKHDAPRRFMFRTVSQIEIKYRASALSQGEAGTVHGGDRLPWAGEDFEPLRQLEWQVHVHGAASSELTAACRELGLPLHVMAWSEAAARAGFARDAMYLVRPDGHVALANAAGAGAALRGYWQSQGLGAAR